MITKELNYDELDKSSTNLAARRILELSFKYPAIFISTNLSSFALLFYSRVGFSTSWLTTKENEKTEKHLGRTLLFKNNKGNKVYLDETLNPNEIKLFTDSDILKINRKEKLGKIYENSK